MGHHTHTAEWGQTVAAHLMTTMSSPLISLLSGRSCYSTLPKQRLSIRKQGKNNPKLLIVTRIRWCVECYACLQFLTLLCCKEMQSFIYWIYSTLSTLSHTHTQRTITCWQLLHRLGIIGIIPINNGDVIWYSWMALQAQSHIQHKQTRLIHVRANNCSYI